jgi:cytochrome c oxidase assembly protein subunit 15
MKQDHNPVIFWLSLNIFMIFIMALIGAATRLTESGLSITEWNLVMGTLPPLNEAQWLSEFDKYKATPEFIQRHMWMELSDFKNIYLWEWVHRLWGRLIGLVYAVPLFYFLVTKKLPQSKIPAFIGLLFLGGLQGFVGWWMVQSGLVDRPDVSHFRLATHLGLAFLLMSCLLWLTLDIAQPRTKKIDKKAWLALALLSITIIYGAFVAGLKAGLIYNHFPMMDQGHFLPPELAIDYLHNSAWIQFTHRWLAIITGSFILYLAILRRDKILAGLVFLQVALGIFTILSHVNIVLATMHQGGAALLLLALIAYTHKTGRK